jgi:hypothetical protein
MQNHASRKWKLPRLITDLEIAGAKAW